MSVRRISWSAAVDGDTRMFAVTACRVSRLTSTGVLTTLSCSHPHSARTGHAPTPPPGWRQHETCLLETPFAGQPTGYCCGMTILANVVRKAAAASPRARRSHGRGVAATAAAPMRLQVDSTADIRFG